MLTANVKFSDRPLVTTPAGSCQDAVTGENPCKQVKPVNLTITLTIEISLPGNPNERSGCHAGDGLQCHHGKEESCPMNLVRPVVKHKN